MKKKKIDFFFVAWILFYILLFITGIYFSYIEISNSLMLIDYLKSEVKK